MNKEVAPLRILVLAVGGCGINALNSMLAKSLSDVEFAAIDSDPTHFATANTERKILLSPEALEVFATAAAPHAESEAVKEGLAQLRACMKGCDAVYIVAGMGGCPHAVHP